MQSSKGAPGHLNGIFTEDNGSIFSNTVQGVFGKFESVPESDIEARIASAEEIIPGDANILCTLDDNIICQYDIKIEKINHNSDNTKNFVIKVTDEKLIEKTGGIVQGM